MQIRNVNILKLKFRCYFFRTGREPALFLRIKNVLCDSFAMQYLLLAVVSLEVGGNCFSRVYSLNENIAAANLFICCFPITSLQLM